MIKRILSGISVSFQHKDTIPSMLTRRRRRNCTVWMLH